VTDRQTLKRARRDGKVCCYGVCSSATDLLT